MSYHTALALNGRDSFTGVVAQKSGQPIELCYQCGKCSAGCPMSAAMDLKPNQMMELLRLGRPEPVWESLAIWLCVGCETCAARCPNGISIGRVMDCLREMGNGREANGRGRKIKLFHREFLNSVRANGRVHEPVMLTRYKLKTGDIFSDLNIGVRMFRKGKFNLLPERIKDRASVRELFNQTGPHTGGIN